jgi:polyphenol oxidase
MEFESFPHLARLACVAHAFTLRTAADTKADAYEQQVIRTLGYPADGFASAEQPHGAEVATVTRPASPRIPGVDALITTERNLPLLIRCADCAAIFIVDPIRPAIALIHSGKSGTLANIVGQTVVRMRQQFGTDPRNCCAVVSPSIGPCHYELDLWDGVERQLREAGIADVHNPRICTACHRDRYFSYRAEKGRTGRMFAVLALTAGPC